MNKFWRQGLPVVCMSAALAFGLVLTAQAQGAADTISKRQEAMKGMGGAMRTLTPMVRGEQPWNQGSVVQAATTVNSTAKVIPSVFPAGTGPDAGKTDALPAIWTNNADFAAKAKALEDASAQLLQLAQAGNEAGAKAQFANIGRACGGCHETYRVKK
jgi:cytochrome c556